MFKFALKKSHYKWIAVAIIIYLCFSRRQSGMGDGTGWTVYGTDWCGYTKKQMVESPNATYVNCDDEPEKCKTLNIKGFPVSINGNQRKDGFTPGI